MGHQNGNQAICPRCGRVPTEPALGLCRQCYEQVVAGREPPAGPGEQVLRMRVSPLVREALAAVQPGEDFDEALLRVLKAYYPQEATSLLPAVVRLIEVEQRQSSEDRGQTLRRLAEAVPGPEITLRTSGGGAGTTFARSLTIRAGGKEYHSLDEVPEHLRSMVAKGMSRREVAHRVKVGCGGWLLGGWMVAVLRGLLR